MYELHFTLRHPLYWLATILSAIFALLLGNGVAYGELDASQSNLLGQMTFQTLTLMFVVAGLTPAIMQRDASAHIDEIVNSSPTNFRQLNSNRAKALVSLVFINFLLCGILLTLSKGFTGELLGTIGYATIIVLPTILLLTTVAMLIVNLGWSPFVTYFVFIALWFAIITLGSITGLPILAGSSQNIPWLFEVMYWLDPFGFTPLTQYVLHREENSIFALIVNRSLYAVVSLMALYALVNKRFTTRKSGRHPQSSNNSKTTFTGHKTDSQTQITDYVNAKQSPHFISSFFAQTKVVCQRVINSKLFWLTLVIWVGIVFNNVASGLGDTDRLSQYAPNSIDALNRIAFDVLPRIGVILIALFAWQLGSHFKSLKVDELISASPISNAAIFLAQITAVLMLSSLFILSAALGTLVAECVSGSDIVFSEYVKPLLTNGFSFLVCGTLFITCFHVFKTTIQATVAMCALLVVKFSPVTSMLGIQHHLWNIGSIPLYPDDNLWFGQQSSHLILPYALYWIVAILVAITIAIMFSHRLAGFSFSKVNKVPKTLPLAVTSFAIVTFSFVQQTISDNPMSQASTREQWKADYEHTYANWKNKAQPTIQHLDVKVDIFNTVQIAKFNLTYRLVNDTQESITEILIGRSGRYSWPIIEFENTNLDLDETLNQGIYKLKTPMNPGDILTFTSQFEYQTPKLLAQQNHSFIGNSFTYLRSVPLIPTVGYQVNYQLTDKNLRLRHNLSDAITLPSKALSANRTNEGKYDWLTVNSTVSVDLGQTALSQGKLERSWQENDRLYFKFSEHVPMRAIPTWLSVPSALLSEQSNNTKVNIFTKHNNDATSTIMRATKDTLDWLTKHVAPYRYEQLNIVNAPDQISGYALPQIILLGDRNNFRATPKPDSGFDQRYRRAAHETAHQWFGHDIGNGVDADRAFLIESLAKYIELVVIEMYQGKEQMEALVEYEKGRFNRALRHSMSSETGLIDANTSHEQYSKATIVFAELRQLIGDDVIISALKRLWLNHSYPNEPAHSMDFLHYLLQSTPEQHLSRVKALLTEPLN